MIETIGVIADIIIIISFIGVVTIAIITYRKTKRAIREVKETIDIMKKQFESLKNTFSGGGIAKLLGFNND